MSLLEGRRNIIADSSSTGATMMFALFRRVCLRAVVLASYCAFLGCGVGGHEPDLRTLIYFHVCIKFYILRSLPAHFFFATNCRRPGTNQWNINCSRISIIFHISFSPSKGASWCIFRYLARIFCPSDRSVRPVSSHGTEAGLR